MPTLRSTLAALVLGACLLSGGCTLAKPLVGAVTGPFVILGQSNGDWCGHSGDGRAVLCAFALLAVVGAGGGLVTGVISDVQAVCGAARDPCNNWWDPFKTNTCH